MPFSRKRFSQAPTVAASVPSKQRVRDVFTGDSPSVRQADIPGAQPSGPSRVLSLIDDDGKLNSAGPGQTGITRLELDMGIDTPGLRFWKDTVKTIDLDAKTGDAFFKGTITGGSLRMDDSAANNSYVWIADLDGLRWRRDSDDKNVTKIEGAWSGTGNDFAASINYVAEELSGGSDGTAQGREARIFMANQRRTTDPGNNAVAWNSSSISLYTRWKTASSLAELTVASISDTVRRVTLHADQLFLNAYPSPSSVGNSKYSSGTQFYGEETSNVSFTTTQTDIVSAGAITTIAGRRYKITCGWPRMATDGVNATVEMRIAEAGVGIVQAYAYRLNTANVAEEGDTISAVISPSAGSHTYKLAGIRTGGAGTITVVGASGGYEQWILVEDIGHT